MIAMQGYYNGTVCIPEEGEKLQMNQKVIITALDEIVIPKTRKLGTLEGKGTVSFAEDWSMSDEELIGE
ncbi:MAG: hypothetical protein NC337_09910 [Roseburia sp.]|nr:hypothetical protein [Roseburia sp.]